MSQIRTIEQYRIINTGNRNLIIETDNGLNRLLNIINLSRNIIDHIEVNQ